MVNRSPDKRWCSQGRGQLGDRDSRSKWDPSLLSNSVELVQRRNEWTLPFIKRRPNLPFWRYVHTVFVSELAPPHHLFGLGA